MRMQNQHAITNSFTGAVSKDNYKKKANFYFDKNSMKIHKINKITFTPKQSLMHITINDVFHLKYDLRINDTFSGSHGVSYFVYENIENFLKDFKLTTKDVESQRKKYLESYKRKEAETAKLQEAYEELVTTYAEYLL